MVNKLIDIFMQMFLPKVKLVNIQLAEVKIKPTVHDLDRNYHHWVITEHTQERMKQRKISFSEINLAFKYGKESDRGLELSIVDIPDSEFVCLNNYDIKALTYLLPLTVILNKKDKVIKTVYANSKTYFKERIVADQVRKSAKNKYTKRIKGKIKDAEKIKLHKEKKYKKFDMDDEY